MLIIVWNHNLIAQKRNFPSALWKPYNNDNDDDGGGGCSVYQSYILSSAFSMPSCKPCKVDIRPKKIEI